MQASRAEHHICVLVDTLAQAVVLEGADALLPQMEADTSQADNIINAGKRVIEPLLAGKTAGPNKPAR
jgi:hypothetical protein